MSEYNVSIIEKIEKEIGEAIPENFKKNINKRISEIKNYTPKVGIFGKTGVGKSSLCNALFGSDVCPISDIEACTREPQKVLLELGTGKLQLVDVPGVGESGERDKEYDELYQSLLPELDLIFWVFKGDDRAAASDEHFYKKIIHRYVTAGKPFLAIINQVDKVEPFREWNLDQRKPGPKQFSNIEAKRQSIAGLLGISINKVIAISANERYGLINLVDSIVHELPNDKKLVVLEKIKAAEDAEIAIAQAKAAEAKSKVEEIKAKAEMERISLEKSAAEAADKESQRRHELAMAELKFRQEREQREAEERARKDREAAEERERNRNVSHKAQKEAESGFLQTMKEHIVNAKDWVIGKIKSFPFF